MGRCETDTWPDSVKLPASTSALRKIDQTGSKKTQGLPPPTVVASTQQRKLQAGLSCESRSSCQDTNLPSSQVSLSHPGPKGPVWVQGAITAPPCIHHCPGSFWKNLLQPQLPGIPPPCPPQHWSG